MQIILFKKVVQQAMKLYQGYCLDKLGEIADNSVEYFKMAEQRIRVWI